MKLAVIAFTQKGAKLAARIAAAMGGAVPYAPREYTGAGVNPMGGTLAEWGEKAFLEYDGLLFVGACGIAVRAIAPHLKNKLSDPAVVVVDECAQYAISLLSGHIGGANELARRVADTIGAQAVITTATDVNGVFAVDAWAARQGMVIANPEQIKEISGALLAGRQVGLRAAFPVVGALPKGIVTNEAPECGICVSLNSRRQPFAKTLLLFPVILHIGIGCRKGAGEEQIGCAVRATFNQHGFSMRAAADVSSISLKAGEEGLLAFCRAQEKPFRVYEAEALMEVDAAVSASGFVKDVTGADNVCERAALCSAGPGARLAVPKTVIGPVTVAVAAEQWSVRFDER
ncbi:MAG TPA: cobalamin biosynthesis protein CbiG [Clostridiales bacterium]|nr:cobalamin biosynthesis protein CbiG [Clostridiales bacterium]